MIRFILIFLIWFLYCSEAFAAGSIIAAAIGLSGFTATVVGFAINMIASTIVSSLFAPKPFMAKLMWVALLPICLLRQTIKTYIGLYLYLK
jgi:hypothetical protein